MNFPSSQVAADARVRQQPRMKFIDIIILTSAWRMRLDGFRWSATYARNASPSRFFIRRSFPPSLVATLIDSKFKCVLTVDRMKYVIEPMFVYKMFMNYVFRFLGFTFVCPSKRFEAPFFFHSAHNSSIATVHDELHLCLHMEAILNDRLRNVRYDGVSSSENAKFWIIWKSTNLCIRHS